MIVQNIIRLFTLCVVLFTWPTKFDFLALNSLLAYIPIELSFQIKRVRISTVRYVLLACWLLFFPNIPYLATDVVHGDLVHIYNNATKLSVPTVKGWGYIILLFLVVFAYINWGFLEGASLVVYLQEKWKMKKWFFSAGIAAICFLSSMGMYAGRFAPRLHSIYLFTNPVKVVEIIFFTWTLKKLELVGLFFCLHAAVILILYVMWQQSKNVGSFLTKK